VQYSLCVEFHCSLALGDEYAGTDSFLFRKNVCLAVPRLHVPSKARRGTRPTPWWRPGERGDGQTDSSNKTLPGPRKVIDYSQPYITSWVTYPVHMTVWCTYVCMHPCVCVTSLISRQSPWPHFWFCSLHHNNNKAMNWTFTISWSGEHCRSKMEWRYGKQPCTLLESSGDLVLVSQVCRRVKWFCHDSSSSLDCFFCVTVKLVRTF
jgi:hypothetical protein